MLYEVITEDLRVVLVRLEEIALDRLARVRVFAWLLGPHGAIGCASALVYMNPRYILHMFELLQKRDWTALSKCCQVLHRHDEGLAPFTLITNAD